MLKPILAAAIAAAFAVIGATGASAQSIKVGCTSTPDCAPAMIAVDEGIFERLGLDVEMVRIGINSNIPAALVSDSIQIGGPTSTVFLQAADGGLDLVAVAGSSFMSAASNASVAVFVRNGLTLSKAEDYVGRKVGAPGFGAFLHVLFVKWLMDSGVDPSQVNFVETTFATMADVIRSQAVDAVVTGEPILSRLAAAEIGAPGPRYIEEIGGDAPIIFFAASRSWAEANREAVEKFRAGVAEGAALAAADRDKAVAAIARFTEQDPELVRANPPQRYEPELSKEQLDWWITIMEEQNLLQGGLDVNKVVLD